MTSSPQPNQLNTDFYSRRLKTTARISGLMSTNVDFDHFARQAVEIIAEGLELCFSGIYLVDNIGQRIVLRSGSGEEGVRLLKDRHQFALNGESCVAAAVRTADFQLSYHPEPGITGCLPEASLDFALPISCAGEVIGAIYAVYDSLEHPSGEDILIYQITADQLAVVYNRTKLQKEQKTLTRQIERRTHLQRAANQIARTLTHTSEFNPMLQEVTDHLCEGFGLYYAGVFLVEPGTDWAVLAAGYGTAGELMVRNQHRLKIGGNSMVGMSIQLGEVRIALDIGEERIHFKNPHLPYTRSEMAIPLSYAGHTLGALTLQHREENAFNQDDVLALQTLADILAVAVAYHQSIGDAAS
jgi:GAF domain-containing protein